MAAYSACIYVRGLDQDGVWHTKLLCSKTRVALLKGTTIPRLELNRALLLTQLASKVVHSWDICFIQILRLLIFIILIKTHFYTCLITFNST